MNAPSTSDPLRLFVTGVVGMGRLGSALAAALTTADVGRVVVASRRPEQAGTVAEVLGVEAASPASLVERCDLVFLTVPDGAVASAARDLAWREGQAVVHCSGALGLDALSAAAVRGAVTGCLHPLQTFPAGGSLAQTPALFRGIACGIESNDTSLSGRLEAITADLGARPISLEGVDRALYHAAAVLVSNDVVALMAAATRTWTQAGLPDGAAREALAPLLLATAGNVGRLSLVQALTGPVARGDVVTVEGHLRALTVEPDLRELYRRLALELLQLDLDLPLSVTAQLRRVLG